MQNRTKSILKKCALVSIILAAASTILFIYASLTKYDQITEIGTSQWLSILGDGIGALAAVFAIVFLMCAFFAFLVSGIVRYIYDRIYRTPTL